MNERTTRPFPDGFDWGTATAAHQIEGGNWHNDWWAFEHSPGPDGSPRTEDPSGGACDSWNRWADDVDLVARLGLTSYRFSIEWSRIEPEPGLWSHAAIDHYRRQCAALLARGIDPVVTFHHFSSPRWLAARGGWADPATAGAFAVVLRSGRGRARPVRPARLHDQRAQHRGVDGPPARCVPAGPRGARRVPPRHRGVQRRASKGGRRDPGQRPGCPSGSRCR